MSKALSHLRRCSLPDLPQLRKEKSKSRSSVNNFTPIAEHTPEVSDRRRHSLLDAVTLRRHVGRLEHDGGSPSPGTRHRYSSACDLLEEYQEGFWERHFRENKQVPWEDFLRAFIADYNTNLQEFDKDKSKWLIKIMKRDIFEGSDIIYRMKYRNFIQSDDDPDMIWKKVLKYAKNKIFQEGIVESVLG